MFVRAIVINLGTSADPAMTGGGVGCSSKYLMVCLGEREAIGLG